MIYDMELVGAEVHEKSIDIATKFINLFSKYAVCHRLINGTEAFDLPPSCLITASFIRNRD